MRGCCILEKLCSEKKNKPEWQKKKSTMSPSTFTDLFPTQMALNRGHFWAKLFRIIKCICGFVCWFKVVKSMDPNTYYLYLITFLIEVKTPGNGDMTIFSYLTFSKLKI